MRNKAIENYFRKVSASLLIAAMLICDAPLAVLAEPSDEIGRDVSVSEQLEKTGTETKDTEGIRFEEPNTEESTAEEPITDATSEEVIDQEETGSTDGMKTVEGESSDDIEDYPDDTEIEGKDYTMEMAHGAPSGIRRRLFRGYNDSNDPDYYHAFYNQLNGDEKRFYDFLKEYADDFITHSYDDEPVSYIAYEGEYIETEDTDAVSDEIFSAVSNAFGAFFMDYPEVFWIDVDKATYNFSFAGHQTGTGIAYNKVTMKIKSKLSKSGNYKMLRDRYCQGSVDEARESINADKERINDAVASILDSEGFRKLSTVADKAGYINDTLTYNNYYNRHVKFDRDDSNDFAHIAVSALISDESQLTWITSSTDRGDRNAPVCEGYAMAYKVICKSAGIPCVVALGDHHAWNYVQTEDGAWYAVDTTWDDPPRYDEWKNRETPTADIRRYFMVGSETVCSGGDTFTEEGHHANGAFISGAAPPRWPDISTEKYLIPEEEPSVTIRPFNVISGRPNTLYVASAYAVAYDLVPERLADTATITVSSSDTDVIDVDEDGRLRPGYPGQAQITVTAEYTEGGEEKTLTSEPVTVTSIYPTGRIYEDGGKRYAKDDNTLYEGWVSVVNNICIERKVDNCKDVYYFKAKNEHHRSAAVTGEQVIDGVRYLFGSDCRLIKEWNKLESVAITAIPADANQSGSIDINTLSYGASVILTAKITPEYTNDSLDAVWTSSDDSTVKVTAMGGEKDELKARIDILKIAKNPENPDAPIDPDLKVTVTVTAGEEINRQSGSIDIYTRYPVGWHKIAGRTYYGYVSEVTDAEREAGKRNRVEHKIGRFVLGTKEYYFDETPGDNLGAMVTGIVEIGGKLYDYGDDGVLRGEIVKKGFVELSDGIHYYDEGGNEVRNEIVSDEHGNHYYLGNSGRLMTDSWTAYQPTGSAKIFYLYAGDDGVLADGITMIAGRPYLFYTQIDAGKSYPCTLATGKTTTGDKAYYVYNGDTIADHYLLSGYFHIDEGGTSKYYYALPGSDKDPYALQSGWVLVGGVWRHFDEAEGKSKYEEIASSASDGWIQRIDTGRRYYRKSNGKFLTGWQTIDDKRYYFDTDGFVATGLWTIGGKYYYFGENCSWDYTTCMPNADDDYGIMRTGRITYTLGGEEHTNFFNTSGVRVNGWQKYMDPVTGEEKWDFFDVLDPEVPDSYGAAPIPGKRGWYRIVRGGIESRYYFADNKTLAKGWQTVEGNRYYFDTAADANGSIGRMCTGVVTVGSNRYYLREDEDEGLGILLTGHSTAKDKDGNLREYYANASGVLQLGWQKVDGEWSFYDYEKGYRIADTTVGASRWVVIPETAGGEIYYHKYYFKNGSTPVTGMQTIDGRTYFFGNIKNDVNYGRLLTGLIKSGNSYYYGTTYNDEAGANSLVAGELKRGQFTVMHSGESITRYANDKGVIQTGWVSVEGSYKYYLTEKDITDNGYDIALLGKQIRINRVSDTFLNCEWYVGSEAPFANEYFCFRNGTTLLKGWQLVNGYKYYFDPVTGRQQKGICLIDNKWYDLGAPATDGYMEGFAKTGWSDGTAGASDFYYDAGGARVAGWTTIDGKKYYFDKTAATDPGFGYKKRAGLFADGRNTYVLDDSGAVLIGYFAYGGKNYYTNSAGVVQYGWQSVNGVSRYFATQNEENPGSECTSAMLNDGFFKVTKLIGGTPVDITYYLRNGKPVTGFATIAGGRYFFDSTGVMQTGWFTVSGKRYFGYATGELAKGYCEELSGPGSHNYYFDGNNAAMGGLILVEGYYRYFNASDDLPGGFGAERPLTAYGKPAGFYKTEDGSIIYILNGKLQTGWKTVEGKKYYFDKSGILMTGEFVIGRDTYRTYSADDTATTADATLLGSVFSGFYNTVADTSEGRRNATFYYDNNGKRITGWVKVGSDNYYFDPSTGFLRTGRFAVGNYMYFADAKGRRLTGFVKYNDDTYYCDNSGIARAGWQIVRVNGINHRFYFDTNGIMATGLWKIGNSYYYLSKENGLLHGAMMTGLISVRESGEDMFYYANSSGVLQSGAFVIDGGQWYFASEYDHNTYDADLMASCDIKPYMSSGSVRDDWYTVRFNDNDPGVINRDYILINATGGKTIKKGWQTVSGLDGVKRKYYFDTNNGAMRTGYFTVSGKEYRLGDDITDLSTLGTFVPDAMSGFTPIAGKAGKYRFIDKNGVSVTGWIKNEYGPKDTGHTHDKGTFYLYPDGGVATGLTRVGNDFYFFMESDDANLGRMVTDDDALAGGKTYTFGADGKRKTGWVTRAGSKRYFAPELVTAVGTTRDFDGNSSTVYIARIGKDLYRLRSDGSVCGQTGIANVTKGYDPATGIYTDANSKIITGWQTIKINTDSYRMYFMPETGMCATSADNPVTISSNRFLFDDSGVVITGYRRVPDDGPHYCLASDGKMLFGWQKVGSTLRYFDPETGHEKEGGTYIKPDPSKDEGWELLTIGGKPVRYYVRGGKPLTGWQSVPGAFDTHEKMRFYFNPDGTLAYTANATGEISVGNVIYRTVRYNDVDNTDFGQVLTGFYATHGKFRYTDDNGKSVTGWLTVGDRKYYLNENGFLCAGVTDVSGKKYYLSDFADPADCDPVTNPEYGNLKYGQFTADKPNKDYMADGRSGVLTTGWVVVNNAGVNELRFYSADIDTYGQRQTVTAGATSADGTGWYKMTVGGTDHWYYVTIGRGSASVKKGFFNQTITTVDPVRPVRFCLDASTGELLCKEGLFTVGGSRYFGQKDTTMPAGYPSYIVKTGEFTIDTGVFAGKYLADANGVIKTGIQNNRFYSPDDGRLFTGGFFTYNNNVYYAFANGDLAKGRVSLADGDYYFDNNGVRKTGWFTFDKAKYYYNTDGKLLKDGKYIIAGKEYIFDETGKLLTGAFTYCSNSYCTDTSGVLVRGWSLVTDPVTKAKNWRYYALADGKEIAPIYAPGRVAGNYWGVIEEGGVVSAYHILRNTTVCRNGWTAIDNRSYCFDADGKLDVSGDATASLIAGPDGTAVTPAVTVNVKSVGASRYAVKPIDNTALAGYDGSGDFGGYAVSGFVKDGAGKLYYANDKGAYVRGNITVRRGNSITKHYADDGYRLLTGPNYVGDKKYLYDDAEHFGRLLSVSLADADGTVGYDGGRYCTDANGVIQTGWQYVKNSAGISKYRFFDPATGKEIDATDAGWTDWVTLTNGDTYYFKPSGSRPSLTKGFAEIDGKKYYFDSNTGALKKAPAIGKYIRFTVGSDTYEADATGRLTIGWGYTRSDSSFRPDSTHANTTADYVYDKNGRMVRGTYTVSGNGAGVYHFDENGCMDTGLAFVDGKTYVFGKNTDIIMIGGNPSSELSYDRGKLHMDHYGPLDENETDVYASDSKGIQRLGWNLFATGATTTWHYFDPADGKEYPITEERSGSGYTWRVVNDSAGRGKFCFKGDSLQKGWQTVAGRKYYFGTDGRMAVGSVTISGVTYYFNDTISGDFTLEGALMTSGIINVGGKRYYMTNAGSFYTGWFAVNGQKYYADPVSHELAVGFKRIDGNTYYFSELDATVGRMQTGFFKIPDLKQEYYDTTAGASNMYYANDSGVLAESGWKTVVFNPSVSTSQKWSYYLAPNRPCVQAGDVLLTGEVVTGDVLIDADGNVEAYLDDGRGDLDGFQSGVACTLFDENGRASGGTTEDEDIADYYRFHQVTGARRKEVLYFYGNYYGHSIDDNQKKTIASMRRYINTDMEYKVETDDFILVNSEDVKQVKAKGLTSYPTSTFPMCASNSVANEKKAYKSANDIAKYQGGRAVPVAGGDGHVDVCDTEVYSKDVYDHAIVKYGTNNLVLMGASSGAGICLGLYAHAIERALDENDDTLLPAQVILLCPWVDVSMTNKDCNSIGSRSGSTDVATLKYWGSRYTRDARDAEYQAISGPGVYYSFANSNRLPNVDMGYMNNIYIYTGSYDPCSFDSVVFANRARAYGAVNVQVNNYSGSVHGFMFFASNAESVTIDVCRKVMTEQTYSF